jgi:hypothetical protein
VFGPIAAFNVAGILGPPLSAWAAWWWLRRHVHDVPAAIGGLVFGFSPFVVAHSHAGHLQFTWLVMLPLILMLVEDLLWRSPRPIWPQAPLLGLAITVQFFIGTEALLILTIGCVLFVVLVAVSHPLDTWSRLRTFLPAGAVAAGVASMLCAWPLFEQFGNDRAIRQPVQPLGKTGGTVAMLVGAPAHLAFHSGQGPHGHLTSVENGLYVGWPLLVALLVATAWLARRRGMLIGAGIAAVGIVLQLFGARRHIGGLSLPAPLALLQARVAITRNILPGRFAIVMWLAIAWLVAVAADEARRRVRGRWTIAPIVVAGACLLPLLPSAEGPALAQSATPRLFASSMRDTIARGSTVMIAPMATVRNSVAELWQIETGMRFRQLGGYMLRIDGPRDGPSFSPSARTLTALFGINPGGRPFPGEPTTAMLDAARAELRVAHVSTFVVGYSRYAEKKQLALAEQLFGRPPDRRVGGVSMWNCR